MRGIILGQKIEIEGVACQLSWFARLGYTIKTKASIVLVRGCPIREEAIRLAAEALRTGKEG
jgi:hypothetical protein